MKVWMKFKEDAFDGAEQELEHVTEIHFNFEGVWKNRIAFESDIECSGCVYDLSEIDEFEALDDIVVMKPDLLNIRNEIIDSIDDINDYLRDDENISCLDIGCMKESVLRRLENALGIMNEFLDSLGINEDYESD
jgi:hypothetical protein